jgi:tripartite-type tricarboxylate transporter receptor subunit TctC
MGVVVSPKSGRDYTAFIEQEVARWSPVIKAAKVKAD